MELTQHLHVKGSAVHEQKIQNMQSRTQKTALTAQQQKQMLAIQEALKRLRTYKETDPKYTGKAIIAYFSVNKAMAT